MGTVNADVELLRNAYLYGFPLVFNLDQVARFVTSGVGISPAAPFNSFGHSRGLAGPADTFVTINNDTIYSMAQIDLSVGRSLCTFPIPMAVTTSFSSSMRGRTTSPMWATAPQELRHGTSSSFRTTGTASPMMA